MSQIYKAPSSSNDEINFTSDGTIDITGSPVSPGGTINLNLDQSIGIWTPTAFGATIAGTTNYTFQAGTYIKIGKLVLLSFNIEFNNASGTGNLIMGGFPFSVLNNSNVDFSGAIQMTGLTWPAANTNLAVETIPNSITAEVSASGSGVAGIHYVQIAGATNVIMIGSILYQTN